MRCLLPLLAAGLLSLPLSVALAQADTKPRPPAPFPGPKGEDVERPNPELPPQELTPPAQEPAPKPPEPETPQPAQPKPAEPEKLKPSGDEPPATEPTPGKPAPGPSELPAPAPSQPQPRPARSPLAPIPAPRLVELEDLFIQLREERRNVFSEKIQLELDMIELEGKLAPGPGRESLSSNLSSEELNRLNEELKGIEVRVLEMGSGVDIMTRKLELLRNRLEEFRQMEELLEAPRLNNKSS